MVYNQLAQSWSRFEFKHLEMKEILYKRIITLIQDNCLRYLLYDRLYLIFLHEYLWYCIK